MQTKDPPGEPAGLCNTGELGGRAYQDHASMGVP
jgi:hypothetical protein